MPLDTKKGIEGEFFDALTEEEHDAKYGRMVTTHHSRNGQNIETIYDYSLDTVTIKTYNEVYNPVTGQQELEEVSKRTSDYSIEKYINLKAAKESNLGKKRDVNTNNFGSRVLAVERVGGQIISFSLFNNSLDFLLNRNVIIRINPRTSNPVANAGSFDVTTAGNLVTMTSGNTRFIYTIGSNQFTFFDGPTRSGRIYVGGTSAPRGITFIPSPTFAPTNPGETRSPSSAAPISIAPSTASAAPSTAQPSSQSPTDSNAPSGQPSNRPTARTTTFTPSLSPTIEEPTTEQPSSATPVPPPSGRPTARQPNSNAPVPQPSNQPTTGRPNSNTPVPQPSNQPTTGQPNSNAPASGRPTADRTTTDAPQSLTPTQGESSSAPTIPVQNNTFAPNVITTIGPVPGIFPPSSISPSDTATRGPSQITTPPTTSDNPDQTGDSSVLLPVAIAAATAASVIAIGAFLWKRYNKEEEVGVNVVNSFHNPNFNTIGQEDPAPLENHGEYEGAPAAPVANYVAPVSDPAAIYEKPISAKAGGPAIYEYQEEQGGENTNEYSLPSQLHGDQGKEPVTPDKGDGYIFVGTDPDDAQEDVLYDAASADNKERTYDVANTGNLGVVTPNQEAGALYDVANPNPDENAYALATADNPGNDHAVANPVYATASPMAAADINLQEGHYDPRTLVGKKEPEIYEGFGEEFGDPPNHFYPQGESPSVVAPSATPSGNKSKRPLVEGKEAVRQ